MAWTVILDPAEVAVGRAPLDLNPGPGSAIMVDQAGIDWGDAALQPYQSDERVGSRTVDYRLPNRQIVIPLVVGGDANSATFASMKAQLKQKVGLIQREGGWLKRGDSGLYADIEGASLVFGDQYGETGAVEKATLTLDALPDFYGNEVTLDSVASTGGVLATVLTSGGATAVIPGDHPGRCRIIVADTSGHDQLGVIWGLRSRHYDAASTAALTYEAEALTPVNGAAVAALAGASGGSVVTISSVPAGVWVTMLSTNLLAGAAPLTHAGSYRVLARCYSASGAPSFRLLWGTGGLASPVINNAVQISNSPGSFYLLDLGEVRCDAPPVGPNQWFGLVQVFSAPGAISASIDNLILVPVDEAAGTLAAVPQPPPSVVAYQNPVNPTGADSAANGGTIAWNQPNAISQPSGNPQQQASVTLTASSLSHYLQATGFGFSVPSSATITGITVQVTRWVQNPGNAHDNAVKLIKGGAVGTTNGSAGAQWPGGPAAMTYGSSSYLWGTTWTPADINASNFGVALAVTGDTPFYSTAQVQSIAITVYYQLGAGFPVASDTVVAANATAELRTDGMVRQAVTAGPYGPITKVIGDLPRLPPSGIEGRPVQLLVDTSRGDLAARPDAALDAFTAQVKYRPSWIFPP